MRLLLRLLLLLWLLMTSGDAFKQESEEEWLKNLAPVTIPDCNCRSLTCFDAELAFRQCAFEQGIEI